MAVFDNFKLLKEDLEKNGWIMEAFDFNYKKNDYVILAKLYLNEEEKPKYALLKIEFIRADDSKKSLVLPVNSNGFMTDAKTLRSFFDIEYSENLGEIIQQFNKYFSDFIPTQIKADKSDLLKQSMINSFSKSDNQDPNDKYCFNVIRNGKNGKRSPFNDNKTKLLRPNLYLKFKDEPTISFCYSAKSEEEESDEEILLKFSRRR
jgi:hypothetical protein